MAHYSNDNQVAVWHVPSIANKAAPTVAEFGTATKLSPHMTKDGLTVPSNQNMVDDANLEDIFDAQVVGSFGGPVSVTIKRDNGSAGPDTIWNLLTYGLAGFLVVRRGVTAGAAVAAAQKVEVYPIQWHHPVMMQTGTNEVARFTAQGAVTATPELKATIA